MKAPILGILGVIAMIVLGYVTAVHARDMVWLFAPALVILIALVAMGRIFR